MKKSIISGIKIFLSVFIVSLLFFTTFAAVFGGDNFPPSFFSKYPFLDYFLDWFYGVTGYIPMLSIVFIFLVSFIIAIVTFPLGIKGITSAASRIATGFLALGTSFYISRILIAIFLPWE